MILNQFHSSKLALAVYENIISLFPEEAEAYWGELLCRYGIEYVDDPATGKKIPTCHRSSYDSVLDDEAYEMVMEYASPDAKQVYREEAKKIEEIRKGINAVSAKEEPYDVFICYKETDDKGNRSIDSVIAQDVYDALTEKEYRVFFSRITLEDKLGAEYEPYIFAALNSAKVMLVFGTEHDHFNAVWVKNEWSRFLDLMSKDRSKVLIPCYRNMDAYDLPKEFAKFQSQDMGKVGAIQDLVRGVGKIIKPVMSSSLHVPQSGMTLNAALERGYLALEDGDWDQAHQYFDSALNINPKCSEAYLGNALLRKECRSLEMIPKYWAERKVNNSVRSVSNPWLEEIESYAESKTIQGYLSKEEIQNCFTLGLSYESETAGLENLLQEAENWFKSDSDLEKAIRFGDGKLRKGISDEEQQSMDAIHNRLNGSKNNDYQNEAKIKKQFDDQYEDEKKTAEEKCKTAQAKKEKGIAKNRRTKLAILLAVFIIAAIGVGAVVKQRIDRDNEAKALKKRYDTAVSQFESGDFENSLPVFEELATYEDSRKYIDLYEQGEEEFQEFIKVFDKGDYQTAFELIEKMGSEAYRNRAREYAYESAIQKTTQLSNTITLGFSMQILEYLGDYKDSLEVLNQTMQTCYKYGRKNMDTSISNRYLSTKCYYIAIPENRRNIPEKQFLNFINNISGSEIAVSRYNTTYTKDFFEIEYHLDPETDCVLATTINDSPLNLYVFKSEDAFICFGYLTGDHTGVITHRINKQGKMERGLNIESDVLMYYPENRPEE